MGHVFFRSAFSVYPEVFDLRIGMGWIWMALWHVSTTNKFATDKEHEIMFDRFTDRGSETV